MAAAPACDICCEPFNRSTRKPIGCGCGATACRECTERYMLDTPNDPQCMSCRRPWTPAFLSEKFTKVFLGGPLRAHRENILFDREKSLLPDTQADADLYLRREKYQKKKAEIRNKLKALASGRPSEYNIAMYIKSFPEEERKAIYEQQLKWHLEYSMLRAEMSFINMTEYHSVFTDPQVDAGQRTYNHYGGVKAPIPAAAGPSTSAAAAGPSTSASRKRTFIRACPADGCRGFLSTAWKCGLCEVYVCPDCHEVKPGGRDDPDHYCDPDTLASARLIARETRPCPKCSAVIYRISGCDHMFCTSCKTPFHWRTGAAMETNTNPHLFEWRQQHQPAADAEPEPETAPADGICFNEHWLRDNARLYAAHVKRVLGTENTTVDRELLIAFMQLPQNLSHNLFIASDTYNPNNIVEINRQLRVLYLVGKLDEAGFKRRLILAEKNHNQKRELSDAMTLYNEITREIGHRAMTATSVAAFRALHAERAALRHYVCRIFADIASRYNCRARSIGPSGWSIE